jgi:hypothetical protein
LLDFLGKNKWFGLICPTVLRTKTFGKRDCCAKKRRDQRERGSEFILLEEEFDSLVIFIQILDKMTDDFRDSVVGDSCPVQSRVILCSSGNPKHTCCIDEWEETNVPLDYPVRVLYNIVPSQYYYTMVDVLSEEDTEKLPLLNVNETVIEWFNLPIEIIYLIFEYFDSRDLGR